MVQRYFVLDTDLCFGCSGCTAACATANGTPPVWWRIVHKLPPEDGASDLRWLSLACNHCAEPPCVKACPSNALYKREEDGIVLHNDERCLGCRYCSMACPFDAIRLDEESGVISKCHLCSERLEEGREPACVETCFAGALRQIIIGDPKELDYYNLEVPGFKRYPKINPSILFAKVLGDPSRRREKPFPPTISKPNPGGA